MKKSQRPLSHSKSALTKPFVVAGSLAAFSLSPVALADPTLIADTYAKVGLAKSYGNKTALLVGTGKAVFNGYLKFDLNKTMPSGDIAVSKAVLKVFVSGVKKNSAGKLRLHKLPLDASGLNWDENSPALPGFDSNATIDAEPADNAPLLANQWVDFDVTSYIQEAIAAGVTQIGFAISADGNLNVKLESKESRASGHSALLNVVYATAGIAGAKGDTGSQGPQGQTGPQGTTGAQGSTGVQGPTGPQGATGPQGTTGAQGQAGPQGASGVQGAIGPQGNLGPQGAHGLTGAQGVAGPQGALGPQGSLGPQGALGPQGLQGLTGPQGALGPQGLLGPQGALGPQGLLGPQGALGPQGLLGPQGALGPQGLLGPQGALGPQGLLGPQGALGPQGLLGPQGPLGPQGLQGLVGAQGAIGPQGLLGPQGPLGPQGIQGLIGPQGPVGQISGTVVKTATQTSPTTGQLLSATCDAGQTLVGGGVNVPAIDNVVPLTSVPILDGNGLPIGWQGSFGLLDTSVVGSLTSLLLSTLGSVTGTVNGIVQGSVLPTSTYTVYAVCANVPG